MNSIIKNYAALVRFSHTIFAMPFALVSFVYAYRSNGISFEFLLLLKIVLCMILARNAAMGFNRYADRKIDACNPRTASREIPRGVISPRSALLFVIVNSVLFVLCAAWINPLAFMLSPVALMVILGYSYAKRVTWLCHLVLGCSLAIAPAGAYIAVTGTLALMPLLLGAIVLTWVAGFDIIYALQDGDFDRTSHLHSAVSRFGARGALRFSVALHLVTLFGVFALGRFLIAGGYPVGWYVAGAAVFATLIIYQHTIVSAHDISRVGIAFGTTNGVASLLFCALLTIGFYF